MMHIILPEAQEEFENAVNYLNDQREGLGDEFRQEVVASLREILSAPELGSAYDEVTRYRPIRRFRYVIIYAIRETRILVVAIMHEARRPGYWKSRLH